MKSRSLLLLILFSMLFVACSRQVRIRLQRKPQEKKFLFESCYSEDCPSFVGAMVRELDSSLSFCSVSLISSSRILTNFHCLPKDIAKAGSDCGGRIRFVFPETKDHSDANFRCKRVLSVASNHNNEPSSPDWAILELDGVSSRKPVTFRRDAIKPHESVTMYKVDFDTGKSVIRGRIVRTDCLANSSHLLTTDFIGSISALFNVGNCHPFLEEGNSGTAVLDHKREFVGLLSFIQNHPSSSMRKSRYGGGTHGACIPLDGYRPPEECEYDGDRYRFLGDRYAQWYRQQLHLDTDEVAEKVHQENIEKMNSSSVLRFSEMPYRLSEDSFQLYLSEEDPMKTSHRNSLHQMVPFYFPSFPECVDQEGEDSFTFLLSIRGGEILNKDRKDSIWNRGLENYPIRLKNGVEQQMIHFERDDDIYWITLEDSPKNTFPLSDLLGLEETDSLRFQIPVCE